MSFVSVDHSKAQQGQFTPEPGLYECVIASAKLATTRNGAEHISLTLEIRDDVPQDGQGESFNWPLWKKKQPRPSDPAGFHAGTIHSISRVVGLENGKSYDTIDDWLRAIIRKPIRVEVRHEEFNGRTQARVSYCFETEHPNLSAAAQGFVQVDDEELPF